MDHIIPKSIGGSSGPENLAIACAECNSSKGKNVWLTANGRTGAFQENFAGKIDLPPPIRYKHRLPETIQKYSNAWKPDDVVSNDLGRDMDVLESLMKNLESGEIINGMRSLLSISSDNMARHNLIMSMEDAIVYKYCNNGQRVDIALCYAMSLVNAALQ